METQTQNPPKRLMSDMTVLKDDASHAWDVRQSNKMRLRYSSSDHQPCPSLNLIAPVQPSNTLDPIRTDLPA